MTTPSTLEPPTASFRAEPVLILTNGTHSIERLNEAGLPGAKVEWLEVLHEGPVPLVSPAELRRIRAEHFERLGWTTASEAEVALARRDAVLESGGHEELQLWFEHDLFDQLQLLQILDRLAGLPEWAGRVVLCQFDGYLSQLALDQLRTPSPLRVEQEHLNFARDAWAAFCAPSPWQLAEFAKNAPLPFAASALLRLCEEFPSAKNGLGRTELQILEILSGSGPLDFPALFAANQKREEAFFFGDAPFAALLHRLSEGDRPLVETLAGSSGKTEWQLTKDGETVSRGQADRLDFLPAPYWIGGAKISGPGAPRWDGERCQFQEGRL